MQQFEKYLAAEVLNEKRIVSYRALSRALKIHCNAAKEMLYEFHRTTNARKAGSVHATYLIAGTRRPEDHKPTNGAISQGEDSFMADSFSLSSSMPGQDDKAETSISVTSVTMAQEEELDVIKELYENIRSIHIYSLEPGRLDNIHVLSDCNRRIAVDYSTEDPLETWKQYGTIHNPFAKRRTPSRPLPATSAGPAPVVAKVQAVPKAPNLDVPAQQTSVPPVARRSSTSDSKEEPPSKKPAAKAPSLKRDNSSLFKAFSKSKPPTKKGRAGSDTSAAQSPAPVDLAEDEPMNDAPVSDDEKEFDDPDFALVDNSADTAAKAETARKARDEREAALRKMMEDDDDEPMEDPPAPEEGTSTHSPPLEPTADGQSLQPQSPAELDTQEPPSQPGRRRGRRKVMKKKTTRDAEGYLVTKEEAAWESFSEEEPQVQQPAAKKVKMPTPAPAPSSGADKGAKDKSKKGKPGQGNIMSFFGKK